MSLQPWYTDDYYLLIKINHDKKMLNLGVDCEFLNLKTNETFNHFDKIFYDVTNLNETKSYLRNLKIDKILWE